MAQLANSPPSSAAFYKESSFAPVAPLPIQPNIFHALVTPEMASVVHGWAKLNSRARSFCGPPTWWEVPRFGSFSVTFPGHEQGSEWEVENLGHNPAPIWAPGTCKARIYPLGYPPGPYSFILIWKAEKEKMKQRPISHPLVYSSNAHKDGQGQSWEMKTQSKTHTWALGPSELPLRDQIQAV